MRRKILFGFLFLLLGAGAAFWWWSRPLPILNVVTWAGVYGRAQAAAQMQPYGVEKRVNVRILQWAENGTVDELRRAITAGQAGDVVDLELPVAVQACADNLLEPLDAAALPPGTDGTPAAQDFYRGMVGRCFVASAVYGHMIACAAPCALPQDLPALFAAVAGGRTLALQRGARVNLEMALLADGVPPDQVYALLATEAGAARAFARLEAIKPNIVWQSGDPIALLQSGRAAFVTALTAAVQATSGTVSVMPQQFTEADVLAIPRGTAKREMALDYLHYATGSAPLAAMTRFAPFAPPRRSSLPLVEKLPPSPQRDFVLSQKGMLDRSFAIDAEWWRDHGQALEQRFRIWAAG